MDKLVYLYYIILPVLLFFGAKIMKKGEWNEDLLRLLSFFTIHHRGLVPLG